MTDTSAKVLGFDDYAIGDEVWCLAWVGKLFTVVDKNPNDRRISIEGPSATDPYGSQIDILPDTMYMLTKEPWDQIWYWPDRAGETYETVVDRFMDGLEVGRILTGYYLDSGPAALRQGMHVTTAPVAAMTFRVQFIDPGGRGRQVWVEAMAPFDAQGDLIEAGEDREAVSWRRVSGSVPLRIGMRAYRWSLSFGDFVLNWSDFLPVGDPRGTTPT